MKTFVYFQNINKRSVFVGNLPFGEYRFYVTVIMQLWASVLCVCMCVCVCVCVCVFIVMYMNPFVSQC